MQIQLHIQISNLPSRNISYVSTNLFATFVCRWSILGRSELGIPSHAAGNENDEIRYRLRSRHASWGETIFRRVDEQFSVETECFKKRYGNSLFSQMSVFKICYFSVEKSSYHPIILDYICRTRAKKFSHMTNGNSVKIITYTIKIFELNLEKFLELNNNTLTTTHDNWSFQLNPKDIIS